MTSKAARQERRENMLFMEARWVEWLRSFLLEIRWPVPAGGVVMPPRLLCAVRRFFDDPRMAAALGALSRQGFNETERSGLERNAASPLRWISWTSCVVEGAARLLWPQVVPAHERAAIALGGAESVARILARRDSEEIERIARRAVGEILRESGSASAVLSRLAERAEAARAAERPPREPW